MELFEITFSISFSSFTKRFPVEEPANSFTPQHLTISAPHCYKLLGSLAQMNPPIREKKHQDMLWKAIKEGIADTIGSDHAPHGLENKKKEYPQTPSGMPGVQTLVPLMLNHVNNNKLTLNQFIKLVCENPCRIFGIKNKGLSLIHI